MIFFKLFLITIFSSICLPSSESTEDYYIRKTNEQFNLINDYKVDMVIRLEIFIILECQKRNIRFLYKT